MRTASVSWPPSSKPTYPGGEPTSRETVCFSMYSDMSKRIMAFLVPEHGLGQSLAQLGLAHAGGAQEDKGADGAVLGSFKPTRPRRMALAMALTRLLLSDDTLVQGVLQAEQPLALLLGELGTRARRSSMETISAMSCWVTTTGCCCAHFSRPTRLSRFSSWSCSFLLLVPQLGGPLEVLGVDSGCLVHLHVA